MYQVLFMIRRATPLTLTNYNNPTNILVANEMGDDLKLNLVGDNHISELVVYGFGWGGNLEITGDGSLTINENENISDCGRSALWLREHKGLLSRSAQTLL